MPRLIVNCATSWMSLSCRFASPAFAHVCQYVVATIERGEQDERGDADVRDLLVHRTPRAFARLEIEQEPGKSTKFATTLEPP